MNKCVFFVIALILKSNVDSAKILAVFPMTAPSHYFLGNALLRGLAEKGHDVTMISPFIENNPPKNGSYRDIVLTGFMENFQKLRKEINIFDMEKANPLFLIPLMVKLMLEMSENTLQHSNVQGLINSDEKFDVVIVEQFNNEAHKAFASHFKAPLILFSTIGASSWVNPLVGNSQPLAYVPEPLLSYSSEMTFNQRLINTIMYSIQQLCFHWYLVPQQNKLVKKYFPSNLELDDVLYNASIVLLNSHPSLNQPVPYVPNMIDVGGFHVQPVKKLPKDLQEFLANAKEGVIYFSLGSNIKSAEMPVEKREVFLKTFSKLKQKILWKWEDDVLPGQPSNVKLGKWLPQQDILAHPNIKLFITHGGLLSTTETVYHGVPVLAIPFAGDQKLNALRTVNQGYGLSLGYRDVTEETLSEKINELLTNPKYREMAKSKSKSFHDRLVKPMDMAIYWVEYVIRHGGAQHLRVASLDLPLYKYFLLDVIVSLLIIILVVLVVVYIIIKKLLCFISKKKIQKEKIN
ncbi:UDP-glycosyltransferase UGT5-like isoform X1 [Tribolium madens]|uniref:UDP-glycosyltransferase UGT5-like isoform X1 n=1 Tax=Tribolium madens TaxID=41895 RepID=UPI001CF758CB|nr:UDP-glycosyltransferase UGT5-like isoform X1 [Tribolium madens]